MQVLEQRDTVLSTSADVFKQIEDIKQICNENCNNNKRYA